MDYIRSCIIMDDYIDVLANGPTYANHRRISSLKNTKEEIILAFQIFVAHMFLFGGRTQDYYDNLEMAIHSLDSFLEDDLVDRIVFVNSLKNEKVGLFTSKQRKANIETARKEWIKLESEAAKRLLASFSEDGWHDSFLESITPLSQQYQGKIRELFAKDTVMTGEFIDLCEDYCKKAYMIITNKPPTNEEKRYFLPVILLKDYVKDGTFRPSLEYKNYILYSMPD